MPAMEPEKEGAGGKGTVCMLYTNGTVWFGSTRREIDDGSDEKIPAGGTLSELW